MNLTPHFTFEELTFSSTAVRNELVNKPSEKILANMQVLAAGLEQVRELLGFAMHINSGYRCPALNQIIGGAKRSAHIDGWAADFICPGFGTPLEIVKALEASSIQFDKCIQEGTWVHISFDPRARRQMLTAHFTETGTVYTQGV